jgi:Phage integrase, N-terminal SAM-like domain
VWRSAPRSSSRCRSRVADRACGGSSSGAAPGSKGGTCRSDKRFYGLTIGDSHARCALMLAGRPPRTAPTLVVATGIAMTPPRLMEQVRAEIRARHYSRRTEDAYVHWIRRFIVFHGRRHPRELGAPEVSAFLVWLAVEQHVAASTQNQALSGVLFLYRHVLRLDIGVVELLPRARMPSKVPVVLSPSEVRQVLDYLIWRSADRGDGALWCRAPAAGVPRAAGEGSRFRAAGDHRPAGKRTEGSA